MRRNQDRFSLAAEAAQDLIWDWDVIQGNVTWAGETRQYFGASPGATPPRDYRGWAARVHPDDLAFTEVAARAAFDSGARSWEHEYRFCRTDGSYAWVLERASILRDRDGRPVRVVGAMRDITQRKVAEEATLLLSRHRRIRQ